METRKAYPALIKKCKNDYLVFVPDLELYTEGKSLGDAIYMARDAIELKLLSYDDDGITYPAASDRDAVIEKAKQDADKDFDFSDGILTFIDIDVEKYRKRIRNQSIKKNCTIPYWLNQEAESAGINFSYVLREALIKELQATK